MHNTLPERYLNLSLKMPKMVPERYLNLSLSRLRGGFKKKNGKFGPLAKTRRGVRTGSEGPIELF